MLKYAQKLDNEMVKIFYECQNQIKDNIKGIINVEGLKMKKTLRLDFVSMEFFQENIHKRRV